jgi:hypothetical protein
LHFVFAAGEADDPPQGPFASRFQVVDHVPRLDSAGEKFHSGVVHIRKKPLAAFIDEGDAGEIDDVPRASGDLPRILPTGAELLNPRAGEAAAEGPLLARFRGGITNAQHIRFRFAAMKGTRRANRGGGLRAGCMRFMPEDLGKRDGFGSSAPKLTRIRLLPKARHARWRKGA